jgi:hypothetical protein
MRAKGLVLLLGTGALLTCAAMETTIHQIHMQNSLTSLKATGTITTEK